MAKRRLREVASSLNKICGSTTRPKERRRKEMRKQLLKGFAMLMAVMAMAMVTAVASANGQTVAARADVPFDFAVGNHNLPAGDYSIRSIRNSSEVLRIATYGTAKNATMQVTMPARNGDKRSMLVFHRYGQRYFLAEVWSASGTGVHLTVSREERSIQKELSRIAVYQKGKSDQFGCETVAIALNQ
jgi:hypothetical protein